MENKIHIIWYNSLDSTQNEVQRHLEELDNLSVIAAHDQTTGRGQRGNSWLTEPGLNLTASLLVRFGRDGIPPLPARDYFRLNMAFSLAMHDYLDSLRVSSLVKWPNDIYVRGKKICGVLIENVLSGGNIGSSVIGFGLNLNQTDFPALANATSVKCVTGMDTDVDAALEDLSGRIVREIIDALEGDGNTLRERYEAFLFWKSTRRRYRDLPGGEEFEGTLTGVSSDGRAILETDQGTRLFAFKELGYIL